MDPDYLENLNNQPNSSDGSNFRQMILRWLNGDDPVPTWKSLCKALRAPAVEEEEIARHIEKERVVGDEGGSEDVIDGGSGMKEATAAAAPPPPSVRVKTSKQWYPHLVLSCKSYRHTFNFNLNNSDSGMTREATIVHAPHSTSI